MNKIIFDPCIGPGLLPIKYGTTHDNYLKYRPTCPNSVNSIEE